MSSIRYHHIQMLTFPQIRMNNVWETHASKLEQDGILVCSTHGVSTFALSKLMFFSLGQTKKELWCNLEETITMNSIILMTYWLISLASRKTLKKSSTETREMVCPWGGHNVFVWQWNAPRKVLFNSCSHIVWLHYNYETWQGLILFLLCHSCHTVQSDVTRTIII